jgi:16S rRNA (guanine527-N7)-methyltransferase
MFRERLAAAFAPYALLSDDQLGKLEQHYQLLLHWNQRLNLTRIRDLDEAVLLNYCESLFVGHILPPGPLRVVDIGSGGGFPGIPFAILRPECRINLVESHTRKAVFLREASRGLSNIEVSPIRAESIIGTWDWTISRAVRPVDVMNSRLSRTVALLMSTPDLAELPSPDSTFRLPWGRDRIIALFHVEQKSSN